MGHTPPPPFLVKNASDEHGDRFNVGYGHMLKPFAMTLMPFR